jgi:hypothetical protein
MKSPAWQKINDKNLKNYQEFLNDPQFHTVDTIRIPNHIGTPKSKMHIMKNDINGDVG